MKEKSAVQSYNVMLTQDDLEKIHQQVEQKLSNIKQIILDKNADKDERAEAAYELFLYYVDDNKIKAEAYLQKSSELGSVKATRYLVELYERGYFAYAENKRNNKENLRRDSDVSEAVSEDQKENIGATLSDSLSFTENSEASKEINVGCSEDAGELYFQSINDEIKSERYAFRLKFLEEGPSAEITQDLPEVMSLEDRFILAAKIADREEMDELLAKGVDINYLDDEERSALFYAYICENYLDFDYLISLGAETELFIPTYYNIGSSKVEGSYDIAPFIATNNSFRDLDARSSCAVSASEVRVFAHAIQVNNAIETLRLRDVNGDDLSPILQAIESNQSIKSLTLIGNGIFRQFSHVNNILRVNSNLKSLKVECQEDRQCYVDFLDMIELAQILENNESLVNFDCPVSIDNEVAAGFAKVIARNKILKSLVLHGSYVDWDCEGMVSFAQSLATNNSLTKLHILGGNVSGVGAIEMARALNKNNTLRSLAIRGTIAEEFVISLCEVMQNNESITDLHLGFDIREEAMNAIAKMVELNSNLRSLDFSSSIMESEELLIFARAFAKNDTIESINLGEVNFDEGSACNELAKALKKNDQLVKFHISGDTAENQILNKALEQNSNLLISTAYGIGKSVVAIKGEFEVYDEDDNELDKLEEKLKYNGAVLTTGYDTYYPLSEKIRKNREYVLEDTQSEYLDANQQANAYYRLGVCYAQQEYKFRELIYYFSKASEFGHIAATKYLREIYHYGFCYIVEGSLFEFIDLERAELYAKRLDELKEIDSTWKKPVLAPIINNEDRLIEAAKVGDLEEVEDLLKAGVNINYADIATGKTAIYFAFLKLHQNIFQFLKGQGAETNLRFARELQEDIYSAKEHNEGHLSVYIEEKEGIRDYAWILSTNNTIKSIAYYTDSIWSNDQYFDDDDFKALASLLSVNNFLSFVRIDKAEKGLTFGDLGGRMNVDGREINMVGGEMAKALSQNESLLRLDIKYEHHKVPTNGGQIAGAVEYLERNLQNAFKQLGDERLANNERINICHRLAGYYVLEGKYAHGYQSPNTKEKPVAELYRRKIMIYMVMASELGDLKATKWLEEFYRSGEQQLMFSPLKMQENIIKANQYEQRIYQLRAKLESPAEDEKRIVKAVPILNDGEKLILFSYIGDLQAVKNLLNLGVNIDYLDREVDENKARPALYYAFANGHYEVCKYLIGQGAKINLCLSDYTKTKINDAENNRNNEGVTPGLQGVDFVEYAIGLSNNLIISRISFGGIEDKGVIALAGTLVIGENITHLSLKGDKISYKGIRALAKAIELNNSLLFLDLSECNIGDKEAVILAQAFEKNSSIINLKLEKNQIGAIGASALSNALKVNRSIIFCSLKNNHIGDFGAENIASLFSENKVLNNLNLSKNSITSSGAQKLAHELYGNRSLKCLFLAENKISDQGLAELANLFHIDNSLEEIDVSFNDISAEGIELFCKAILSGSVLNRLHLGGNYIGNKGVEAVSQMLKVNHLLNYLDLYGTGIDGDSISYLAEALRVNKGLSYLNLGHVYIDNYGAVILARALEVNNTLTTLDLNNDHHIGDMGAKAIAGLISVNRTIVAINFGSNLVTEKGDKALSDALRTNHIILSVGSANLTNISYLLNLNLQYLEQLLIRDDISFTEKSEAAYKLATHYSASDQDKSLKYLTKASQYGHLEAAKALADLYNYGWSNFVRSNIVTTRNEERYEEFKEKIGELEAKHDSEIARVDFILGSEISQIKQRLAKTDRVIETDRERIREEFSDKIKKLEKLIEPNILQQEELKKLKAEQKLRFAEIEQDRKDESRLLKEHLAEMQAKADQQLAKQQEEFEELKAQQKQGKENDEAIQKLVEENRILLQRFNNQEEEIADMQDRIGELEDNYARFEASLENIEQLDLEQLQTEVEEISKRLNLVEEEQKQLHSFIDAFGEKYQEIEDKLADVSILQNRLDEIEKEQETGVLEENDRELLEQEAKKIKKRKRELEEIKKEEELLIYYKTLRRNLKNGVTAISAFASGLSNSDINLDLTSTVGSKFFKGLKELGGNIPGLKFVTDIFSYSARVAIRMKQRGPAELVTSILPTPEFIDILARGITIRKANKLLLKDVLHSALEEAGLLSNIELVVELVEIIDSEDREEFDALDYNSDFIARIRNVRKALSIEELKILERKPKDLGKVKQGEDFAKLAGIFQKILAADLKSLPRDTKSKLDEIIRKNKMEGYFQGFVNRLLGSDSAQQLAVSQGKLIIKFALKGKLTEADIDVDPEEAVIAILDILVPEIEDPKERRSDLLLGIVEEGYLQDSREQNYELAQYYDPSEVIQITRGELRQVVATEVAKQLREQKKSWLEEACFMFEHKRAVDDLADMKIVGSNIASDNSDSDNESFSERLSKLTSRVKSQQARMDLNK